MPDISKEFVVVACPDRNPAVQIHRNNRRWLTVHVKDFGEAMTLAHVIAQAAPQLLLVGELAPRAARAAPMTDRDRLEILARVITQLVPERPDCGLSPESLLRLQRLTQSHLDGSRAAAEST